ncbi:MAG: hypothetical protein KDK70_14195, partial [Myxococcales bacterium]|nr:hypothetical protein [Myxococcales bacterium]
VPVTTAEELAEALASTEVPIQEAALGALVWLDVTAPALPILLEHLDGDRRGQDRLAALLLSEVTSMVDHELRLRKIDRTGPRRDFLRRRKERRARGDELARELLVLVYDDDAALLRRWDPSHGRSFRGYLGFLVRRFIARRVRG